MYDFCRAYGMYLGTSPRRHDTVSHNFKSPRRHKSCDKTFYYAYMQIGHVIDQVIDWSATARIAPDRWNNVVTVQRMDDDRLLLTASHTAMNGDCCLLDDRTLARYDIELRYHRRQ